MIPLKLELSNFLPYVDPDPLDFSGLHVACLTGDNGAGKSSLLDAMTWALWGRARAKTDEELIHQGASEMRVAFVFELQGQVYQVIRQKRAGRGKGSSLELQIRESDRWKGISEATINTTQKKIIALLKLDYDTFCNSAFLQQGKADEFTRKTPTQRKDVLADILGLDQWAVYEDRAKKKVNALKEQIVGIDGEVAGYERELSRKPEYESQLVAATGKLAETQNKVAAAESQWAEVERARDALNLLKRQRIDFDKRMAQAEKDLAQTDSELRAAQAKGDPAALARELEAAQNALARLDARETERVEVTEKRQAAAEDSARRKGENDTLGPQTEPLKKRVETLSAATEPVCPTCGQPLTEDHRHSIIAELTSEVESRRNRYRENTQQLKALAEQLANYDRQLTQINADLRERPSLQKKLADLQGRVAVAAEAQAQVEALIARRARQLDSLNADREQRAALEAETSALASKAVEADSLQNALDKLRWEQRVAAEELGAARQRLASLEAIHKYRADKLAARKKLADEQGIYEELREAFGKRGVPAMIIEAAVPEIESAANDLLRRMTAGRMNVRFNTQRETQAGDVRETLDIQIADELGTRAYENYSGGEQFRVNFAIRIALSRLLAHRAGAQLQTLIVDEGFGSQDAQGREKLVEAVNAIQDDFARILVITHLDDLKDAFPARIDVVKTARGSQISVA
ncbi:MAG: SMC family ATPase [Chloroflexi bacterium]|nr:SMC family ATPase [Chloroflexota bacterium]